MVKVSNTAPQISVNLCPPRRSARPRTSGASNASKSEPNNASGESGAESDAKYVSDVEESKSDKTRKRPAATAKSAKPSKKRKSDDHLQVNASTLHVRSRSPSADASAVSNAEDKADKKKVSSRKPPHPKASIPPKVHDLPGDYSHEDILRLLHLREFLVRFASLLCPSTITTKSTSRSGNTRVSTRAAGWPSWLRTICDQLFTFLDDEEDVCSLLQALFEFVQEEEKGSGRCLSSGASRNVLETLLDEVQEARMYSHKAQAEFWKSVEEILRLEEIIPEAVSTQPLKLKKRASQDDADDALSSDLSDLEESQSPKKKKVANADVQMSRSRKLELVSGVLDLIISGSSSVRTALTEGLETEKNARLKMHKIKKDYTESKSQLKSEKPPGSPSKRTTWQGQVDEAMEEYKLELAENYPELHSQKIRWASTRIFDRDFYLPTPTFNSELYPAEDEEAILGSWSVIFYGTPPPPATNAPSTKRQAALTSSPATNGLVLTKQKEGWYAVSGVEDLQACANWIEGLVKLRVYHRKLEAYERANKPVKDGNASSELSDLEEEQQDHQKDEAEERLTMECVKEIRGFADFVAARQGDPDEV